MPFMQEYSRCGGSGMGIKDNKKEKTQRKTEGIAEKALNRIENSAITECVIKLLEQYDSLSEKERIIYGYIIGYAVSFLNLIIVIAFYIRAIILLKRVVICNSLLYVIPACLLPFLVWAGSTYYKEFLYYRLKEISFIAFCVNAVLCVSQYIYTGAWRLCVVPIIRRVKVTPYMTEPMVFNLARVAVILPTGIFIYLIMWNIVTMILNEEGLEKIDEFKISHVIDLRKNRKNLYDFTAVKDIMSGKIARVYENDRFVHMLISGSTGVGKTSSTLLVAFNADVQKKKKNMQMREMEYLRMVKEYKADVIGPCRKGHFRESWIVPKEGYGDEYNEIRQKYPDCGITVTAPDPDTTDDCVRIARAAGFSVNVIDPEMDEDTNEPKKGLMGMNPFAIPDGLSDMHETTLITNKAQYFYDVMSAMASAKGAASDGYFEGVNNTVAITVARIVMKGVKLVEKRDANILDIQRCVEDYSELKPYMEAIKKEYNLNTKGIDTTQRGKTPTAEDLAAAAKPKVKITDKDRKNHYYGAINRVEKQFLAGSSKEKWEKDSMGLRSIITNFTDSVEMKAMLTNDVYPDLKFIDFDKILRDGEVTVINTSLKMGESLSTAFGLFFILNMKQAVLSRPKKTRINHFWYIDEFALFLNSSVEQMFTLFRKYRCAMTICIQSLNQFDKNNSTKYLKGVILGNCGTHILFGRGALEDIKHYSDLAGTEKIQMSQKTQSQTTLLDPNTSLSESERITPTETNILEMSKIRNRDFQEVVMFTIQGGKVLRPFLGQTDFLSRAYMDPKRQEVAHVAWYKYVTKTEIGRKASGADITTRKKDKERLAKLSEASGPIILPVTVKNDTSNNSAAVLAGTDEEKAVAINTMAANEEERREQGEDTGFKATDADMDIEYMKELRRLNGLR